MFLFLIICSPWLRTSLGFMARDELTSPVVRKLRELLPGRPRRLPLLVSVSILSGQVASFLLVLGSWERLSHLSHKRFWN